MIRRITSRPKIAFNIRNMGNGTGMLLNDNDYNIQPQCIVITVCYSVP